MFYTYILYSEKLSLFYVGQTNNIDRRLKEHNQGLSTYTSTGNPWLLVWFTTKPDRNQAITLEKKLKNLSRARKVRFMLKYKEGLIEFELIKNWPS